MMEDEGNDEDPIPIADITHSELALQRTASALLFAAEVAGACMLVVTEMKQKNWMRLLLLFCILFVLTLVTCICTIRMFVVRRRTRYYEEMEDDKEVADGFYMVDLQTAPATKERRENGKVQ